MRNSSGRELRPSEDLDPHVEVVNILTGWLAGDGVPGLGCWEICTAEPAIQPDRGTEPPLALAPVSITGLIA